MLSAAKIGAFSLILASLVPALPAGSQAADYYGNRFEVAGAVSMGYIDALNKKASVRFTVQQTKTLGGFRLYIHANESGSKTYRYGMQADNAGYPGGTWLGYRDITVSGSSGWLTVDLVPDINLTAAAVYHIVVQPVDNPTKAVALRATNPANLMLVYDQTADPNANTLFNDGAAWTVQNRQPIYFLQYADGSYEGNPCSYPGFGSICADICESERFTVSAADRTIVSVEVYIRAVGSPPNDCRFTLYNITDGVEVASGVIARASEITTTWAWYAYALSTPQTLVAGKQYRLYLKTTGGSSTDKYVWHMPYNYSAAEYNSRNYDGLNSVNETSDDGGVTWPTGWPNYDAVFRFALPTLSITVDPTSVDLGTVLPGAADVISQTARPSGEVLVTNSGDINVKYEISLENPPGWTAVVGTPASAEEYRLSALFHPDQAQAADFDRQSPQYNDVVQTSAKACDGTYFATGVGQDGYDVPPAGTQNVYLDFDAPPSTGVKSQQAIKVTVTAKPM